MFHAIFFFLGLTSWVVNGRLPMFFPTILNVYDHHEIIIHFVKYCDCNFVHKKVIHKMVGELHC